MKPWWVVWGRNVKFARLKKGMSRDDFAEAVGVTVATVSRWESGKLGIRDSHKLKVAEVLEQDVIFLFPLAGPAS